LAQADYSLAELVALLGGRVEGGADVRVRRVATLERAADGDIAFLANPKYRAQLDGCQASAIILNEKSAALTARPRIIARDPYVFFARVAQLLSPSPEAVPGIHPSAVVESPMPDSVQVGAQCSIGQDVQIGEGCVIGPGCVIGAGVNLGVGSRLHAHVTIYEACIVGRRAVLHSGVVIGADGFGFARDEDASWVKIPQTGRVVIGDDVEIGANTTIDRGALDDTVIGDGVKLDNQIQIAHNVRIGDKTIMAACSGVAGSTVIGARCMIGGQAGISGHLTIVDDVVVSAWTLVAKSIDKPGVYTATLPLQTHSDWIRNFAHLRRLDALADRIRALEQGQIKGEPAS
jgi:UDP-3-O-[3-hydroxymyristoyl] glucosamine N-acyltransferase